jgi:hypothetical protein
MFTVTKYYSTYVVDSFLRKITKILDFFTPNKAILQKIVLRYYFRQSYTP